MRIIRLIFNLLFLAWIFAWWLYFGYINKVLLSVYPSLFLHWDVSFNYLPYKEILFAVLTMMAYWFVGQLFLDCFEIYVPRWAGVAIAFTLGVGLTTYAGMLLGLAGLFNKWVIAGSLTAFIFSLMLASRKLQRKSPDLADNFIKKRVRQSIALKAYNSTLIKPETWFQKMAEQVLKTAVAIVIFLTFYHGILFPIINVDSLSYLGMARMLFLKHSFPVKIMAQMGIGTGSNYPQMYRIASAIPCALAGHWSDIFAQILSPACGLFSALLVYHIILRLNMEKLTALSITLLFVCIPYSIRYFTFTSDYALAILFTAAFLYLSLGYLETGLRTHLVLSAIVSALACNINYLMPILVIIWIVLLLLKPRKRSRDIEDEEPHHYDFMFEKEIPTIQKLIKTPSFIRLVLICFLLASPWYFRNWEMTGNPVYPYFRGILGGRHINPDVITSMQGEWLFNGDGIEAAAIPPGSPYNRPSLLAKLRATPFYFITSLKWSWALAPTFHALAIPGLFILLISCAIKKFRGVKTASSDVAIKDIGTSNRFGILALLLFLFLFAYHYFLAGYYLYQIIPILIPISILSLWVIETLRGRLAKDIFLLWCLLVFILPGFPFALMNFKLVHEAWFNGRLEYPWQLSALRRPGMPKEKFYSLVFGEDENIIDHINNTLSGKTLLTHDIRYLLYNPSIKIIHLDDWEVQQAYNLPALEDKFTILRKIGIDYYLKIPMEENDQILKKLSLEQMEKMGYLWEIYRAGGNILYEINKNVSLR